MWNASRNSILMGNPIMVMKKTISIEYCSKLIRL
jgi:hypothetical protein